MKRKVIKNEMLFIHKLNLENAGLLKLIKQSYSDGTYFYILKDQYEQTKVGFCSEHLEDLIKQMELERKVDYDMSLLSYNRERKHVFDEILKWRDTMIKDMKEILASEVA